MTKIKAGLLGALVAGFGWIAFLAWWFATMTDADRASLPPNGFEQGISFQIFPLIFICLISYFLGTTLFTWLNRPKR